LSLNAFFLYFGSKSHLARRYPPPRQETIIEPFAGGASYAVRYHHRDVVLVEKDPVTAAIWRYLLGATAREILALPDLRASERVEDLVCTQEARWLIGRWIDYGAKAPASKRTPWATLNEHTSWGRTVRARLAAQVGKIRHWRLIEGDYTLAPDIEATWFVDPPYEKAVGNMWKAALRSTFGLSANGAARGVARSSYAKSPARAGFRSATSRRFAAWGRIKRAR
jgi:hypothetical protein